MIRLTNSDITTAIRQAVAGPTKATDIDNSDLLLGYVSAASTCAKACNNYWKVAALIIFVGFAAFPTEMATPTQLDALMNMHGIPAQPNQSGTGILFGTSLSLNDYCVFGSLFLLLIAIPFADAHTRYIILKATIDARLLADEAYRKPFVSREEVREYGGKKLSNNYFFSLMSYGEAISSNSETTYSNFTATNHGMEKLLAVGFFKFLDNWGFNYVLRNLNWFLAIFWYTGLPLVGAILLNLRITDRPFWYFVLAGAATLVLIRPLITNIKLHFTTLGFNKAKRKSGV